MHRGKKSSHTTEGSRDDLCNLERGVRGKAQKKDLSKDEAATIIQKQIRGSMVRKEYGPIVKTATGKLDEETAIFMKQWCRKWKLKSIFQVLLLYRATRHQDLVYFCQQAHLYNQNSLSELVDVNEPSIDLKEVDPKATVHTFLPPKKPSVYKLPFRLGDMPYFDSTYICDPTRGMRPGKSKDNDESWDAPLQRNVGEKYARPARSLNFREQGCQTYLEKQEYTNYAKNSPSLPETPFVRDPVKGVKLPYQDNMKGGYKGSAELGKNQIYRGNSGVKKTAPIPPREIVKGSRPGERKHNPIREMEDKFRQNSGESEEPPFNFQAMLRKTNASRESMKRGDDGFISPTNNNLIFSSKTSKNLSVDSKPNTKNVNNNNNNKNKEADRRNESRNGSVGSESRNDNRPIMELAPGLIIHGEVADL